MSTSQVEVVALSGGVGGAKLALGLQRTLPAGALAIVVNTGDDFEHLGLAISPDVDTTLYTLAGIADETRGWGRAGETWLAMAELERLGGPTWFRLGDKDLALHLERTRRLACGEPPSVITADFARRLGVPSHIFPMTDGRVRTFVDTSEGVLEFQHYFVRRRCEPELRRVIIDGAHLARAPAAALGLFAAPSLKAVLICPSNPYLSIDPILALQCWTTALRSARVPVIAVSPLVGGRAIKGPTTKIMAELGIATDPTALARHYAGLIDGLVIDHEDASWEQSCGIPVMVTSTVMNSLADRERLAQETVEFAQQLRPMSSRRTA
jgi:LPPG:FO 2-phospho-L-lactate transferase